VVLPSKSSKYRGFPAILPIPKISEDTHTTYSNQGFETTDPNHWQCLLVMAGALYGTYSRSQQTAWDVFTASQVLPQLLML
jgi:hypothetical protein